MFEGSLLSVEDFGGLSSPTEIEFEKVSCWVRIFHLPLACIGQVVGYQNGSSIRVVEEVETEEDGVGWGEYLQVKVKIDLTKLVGDVCLKSRGSLNGLHSNMNDYPIFAFNVIKYGMGKQATQRRT